MAGYNILNRNKAGFTYLSLLILSLVLFFVTAKDLRFNPKNIGIGFFSAIQKGLTVTTQFTKNTFNSIAELKDLQKEYDLLQSELSRFRTIQRDFSGLQEENKILRKQLELKEESVFKLIPAQVIGKDPSDFYSGISIDKGRKHGVYKDAAVIAYSNGFQGLVGRVAEVSAFNAKIQPIYERESYVASRLQSSRFEGLIEGSGLENHSLLMRYVIKRAKDLISFGDIIVTSGMNSIFPENIYIGRIREIRSKDWNPDIELLVQPIVDFERLEYVYIIREQPDEE